ncbi:PP2C family protein-serine/threonine phosphatase [Paraliomyxa miuraensis]|uniref:PP2C family protein-serine/threonine phosphatase n=1 Tax=Paraliomyxa miuraensis TaxID=376150 RepID=UPI0022550CCE|nr:protein phosphatase 2C domain-containing protein [Paraliomyxa miuraensis]
MSPIPPHRTDPTSTQAVELAEQPTLPLPRGLRRPRPPKPIIEVWGATSRGRVRKENEDQYLVAALDRGLGVRRTSLGPATTTDSPQGLLLAVADGVGGRAGGAIASATAVDAIARDVLTAMPWVLDEDATDDDRLELRLDAWISDAFRRTQRTMRRVAEDQGIDPRMATTFTMAYVAWPGLIVAHVGDSRCYLWRDEELQRLTSDHTMAQHLVAEGHLRPEEAAPFDHMLVNTLGGSSDDLWVELHRLTLEPGDQLLLCSDGLTGHLRDHELRDHLGRDCAIETAVEDLVAHANARGGRDNITVVLARF